MKTIQPLETTEYKSLADRAYREIKLLFYHQKLIPGQKILYERLAQTFNMSRTPVINALGRLEQEGYVVSEVNRGYFVSEISEEEAKDNIDTRELIERHCVRKGIDNLKKNYLRDRIKEIQEGLEAYAAYRPDIYDKKRLYLDREFHLGIAGLAENRIMLDIMNQLFEKLYLRYPLEITTTERFSTAEREHRELLKAISDLDTEGALSVLKAHYEGVRFYLFKAIERSI